MRRAAEFAAWGVGIAIAYLALGVLAIGLGGGVLLTPGVVPWSQPCLDAADCPPEEIGFVGDPRVAYGLDFQTVHYPGELGEAEAWLVPARQSSPAWAIFVHGIGGLRENGYRQLSILHEAGVPVLLITYRNDSGAPAAPDGLFSFGLSEWRDLAAAVDWVLGQGVERVLLVGESMGAAVIGQYLQEAADTAAVAGLALDAPALDFPAVVHHRARHFYGPLAPMVEAAGLALLAATRRDLRQAESLEAVAAFAGPIFLAHGSGDPLVPVEISDRLAGSRPDAIYLRTAAELHLRSYKVDPDGYRQAMSRWIGAARGIE